MSDSVRPLDAGVADLHLHTVASDGTCTVANRIEQARDRELSVIAITDHDRIAPEITVPVEERERVILVAGVEVRADLFDTKIELLGYFVDPDSEALRDVLERARRYRRERNVKMVARINERTGLGLDHDQLADATDGSLGRPHLARELVDAGVVESVGEAFDEYLAESGSCFVPMERVPHGEVLSAIRTAGGVTSLAHPGRIRSERVPEMIAELADAGLDAIEVWYPYGDRGSAYANVEVADVAILAEEHGLLRTGGSDCHGPGSGKFRIGEVRVTDRTVRMLADRADIADGFSPDRGDIEYST